MPQNYNSFFDSTSQQLFVEENICDNSILNLIPPTRFITPTGFTTPTTSRTKSNLDPSPPQTQHSTIFFSNNNNMLENDTIRKLNHYTVPWNLIRVEIMEYLKKKEKLPPLKFTEFIHFIADELRLITNYVKIKQLEIICQKVADKFPETFISTLSGCKLSDKPIQMITKLQSRLNYLRSLEKIPAPRQIANKRKSLTKMIDFIKNTCAEDITPALAATMALEREFLKETIKHPEDLEEKKIDIDNAMTSTLILQKKFFEEKRNLNDVAESWPFLMKKEYFYKYFEFTMRVNLSNLNTKFITLSPSLTTILKATKYCLVDARIDIDDKMKLIEKISLYFGENTKELYDQYEVILFYYQFFYHKFSC